ncbi:Sjogren's syndrome/scleroderma autoantigen 1 family protein [Methanosarcina hadiensis]|uniref:Sjogren's syndrome/scleroderma autoantigen 1 family protein n=1 Tax=Methanosarcina hadiensis TaxID=3078083 RepID=UPI003977914A
MDSEKDKKVKRIARFLELGGTMLAEHCKVCGAPKFRYQGTVICPICDVREEGEEESAPEPAPESVAEVQAPEARPSAERERPSFESRKKAQARRQKPRFGQRAPETEDEEEKTFQPVEEETPETPETFYETEVVERIIPEVKAVPAARTESEQESMVSTASGNYKILENLLLKKMVSIAVSLQNEKNPRSIAEHLELIEKSIGLIERLRKI